MALIVLEGLDSVGKNTQSKLLQDRFERSGRAARLYAFPRYQTPVGQLILQHLKGQIALGELAPLEPTPPGAAHPPERIIRRAAGDAMMFQCLMLADKHDALTDIQHDLAMDRVVICDRWWQSAFAFGAADGLDETWLGRIHSGLPNHIGTLAVLQHNVFIDVPQDEALRRRPEARDRYERDRDKQRRVRENYERLWTNAGHDYHKVDGVGTVEEVHERIWAVVR